MKDVVLPFGDNTPTFTFSNTTYTSQYISFVGIEEFNRAEQTVTTLNTSESSVFSEYGRRAANGESGGLPFVDVADAYLVNCGAQFNLPQIAEERRPARWAVLARRSTGRRGPSNRL